MFKEKPITVGNKPQNLTDWVYETLEEAIISHTLKSGEEIPEYRLAEKLGTSNTPVREALNRLITDGLVVKEPNKAPRVISLSKKEIEELYDIRSVLEGLAIASATAAITDKELEMLQELQSQGETYYRLGSINEYKNYNRQFHNTILAISRNNLLMQMMVSINKKVQFCLSATVLIPGGMERGVGDHRQLLATIKEKNPEQAKALMERHILAGKSDYLQNIQNL